MHTAELAGARGITIGVIGDHNSGKEARILLAQLGSGDCKLELFDAGIEDIDEAIDKGKFDDGSSACTVCAVRFVCNALNESCDFCRS
eukprot:SAG11_NODE_879_length_6759_cov_5.103904_2_plen_88_part_00